MDEPVGAGLGLPGELVELEPGDEGRQFVAVDEPEAAAAVGTGDDGLDGWVGPAFSSPC